MRVGFAGGHEISWFCLKAIADLCRAHGDTLAGVFNQPAEIGVKHSAFVEFDALEQEYGFPHFKVRNLASPETLEQLRALELDVLFIIGWHRIVPQEVIDCAPLCLGMHSSLLPANRGSSPVNWAILRGEREGGMSFFHLTTGVDSGALVGQRAFAIGADDTCADVHAKATVASVELLREHWVSIREGTVPRIPQDESLATTNARRRPQDGAIDWTREAAQLYDFVRALTHPYPGAFTTLRGRKLFLWQVRQRAGIVSATPGTIVAVGERVTIATGTGLLDVMILQFEGDPECRGDVFTTAYVLEPGEIASGAPAP